MPTRGRRFAAKTGIDEGLLPGSAIASAIGQADWMEAALSVEVRCVLSLNRLFTFELFCSTITPETESVSGFVRQARPPDRQFHRCPAMRCGVNAFYDIALNGY